MKNLIPSESMYICTYCGDTTSILIDSEKPGYKEPPPEMNYFAYKRINFLMNG